MQKSSAAANPLVSRTVPRYVHCIARRHVLVEARYELPQLIRGQQHRQDSMPGPGQVLAANWVSAASGIATPGLAAVLASRRPRSSRDEAPEPHRPAPTPGRLIEYEGVQHYVEAAGPPPRRIVEMVAEDRHCGARLLSTGPPPSPEKAIASVVGVVTCGLSTIPSRLHRPAPSESSRRSEVPWAPTRSAGGVRRIRPHGLTTASTSAMASAIGDTIGG